MFAKNKDIYIRIDNMFSCLNHNRIIYILSNLLVLPATVIPNIDFLANLSFFVLCFFLLTQNLALLMAVFVVFVIKNNSNYRFNILLKVKGDEASKSDSECVYLYAWCTLLRYFLIGIAANQIFLLFK